MNDAYFIGLIVSLWLASLGLAYGCWHLERLERRT